MSTLEDLKQAVVNAKRKDAAALTQQALDEGHEPLEIMDDALVPAMDEVGALFAENKIYVPQMLVAARAMTAALDILKPLMASDGSEPVGNAVIGTVAGDMHDIGKNLVRIMIESKNIQIDDLGVDVTPDKFVEYLKEHPECQIVCLSALLTTTMPAISSTIQAITDAGLRDQVKIMVGGAPVTAEFAKEVGADAFTANATEAGNKAYELLTA